MSSGGVWAPTGAATNTMNVRISARRACIWISLSIAQWTTAVPNRGGSGPRAIWRQRVRPAVGHCPQQTADSGQRQASEQELDPELHLTGWRRQARDSARSGHVGAVRVEHGRRVRRIEVHAVQQIEHLDAELQRRARDRLVLED